MEEVIPLASFQMASVTPNDQRLELNWGDGNHGVYKIVKKITVGYSRFGIKSVTFIYHDGTESKTTDTNHQGGDSGCFVKTLDLGDDEYIIGLKTVFTHAFTFPRVIDLEFTTNQGRKLETEMDRFPDHREIKQLEREDTKIVAFVGSFRGGFLYELAVFRIPINFH